MEGSRVIGMLTGVLEGTETASAVDVLGRAVVLLPPETGLIRSTRPLVPQPAAMSLLHPVVTSPVKTIRVVKVPLLGAPVVKVDPATNAIIDMRTVSGVVEEAVVNPTDRLANGEDLEMDPGNKLF